MDINWDKETESTVRNLSALLQTQTLNPPGNEEPAIRLIQDILKSEGFPSECIKILEAAPHRLNLVARIKGGNTLRPLLLTGHVDVVPVERSYWTHDPFFGEVIDGEVWGRGALDMKGPLSMYLQVILLAFKKKLPLKRDIIFAAVADEEAGFTYGSKFLVDRHRELIEAEYAINEAGAMSVPMLGRRIYPIQVAEKGVCVFKMTAYGQPGHGAMPHRDNAVVHIADAIRKLQHTRYLPIQITPTMTAMLSELAKQMDFPYGVLFTAMKNPTIARILVERLPPDLSDLLHSMLHTSISPTMLKAGQKPNVIPSTAEAALDCRILPGLSPEQIMTEILAITGDKVSLEPLFITTGNEFPIEDPFYHNLVESTRQMDPQGVIVPMLMPGATDASEYKRAGIKVYGFTPMVLPEGFSFTKLAHGHDERLPVTAIRSGLLALWRVIRKTCIEV